MFERIIALVAGSEEAGLLVIFFLLIACGLGLPVPEDISIVASGILVSARTTNFFHAFLVCIVGIIIGDSTIYWMGRLLGKKLFKIPVLSKIFHDKLLSIGKIAFHRYGNKIIFFARFLPGLRAPIYFFAGSVKKSFFFFVIMDLIAASISVPIWVYVGKLFAENIPALEKAIKSLQLGSILIVILVIMLFVGAHFIKKKVIRTIETRKTKNSLKRG